VIAKISQGSGFRGALNYICKDDAEMVGGNMAGADERELSSEFGVTRGLRPDIEKPCYHVALSLPAGERLSSDAWQRVADAYLTKMGLDPSRHQAVYVRHTDGMFDHLHIVTSRIALNGKVWKPYQDRIKSRTICRELEKEFGLTVVSSEKKKKNTAKVTQNERRMSERTGREPEKVFVQKTLAAVIQAEGPFISPWYFCFELQKHGVVAIPNIASTGRMNGFAFQFGGRQYTGSQVGYPWKVLAQHVNIPAADIGWLQDRQAALRESTPADAIRSIRNAVWEMGVRGVPFEHALLRQGWELCPDGNTVRKQLQEGGSVDFALDDLIDVPAFQRHYVELQRISGEARAAATERSRELAKRFPRRDRRVYMQEMPLEDVLCAAILFPQAAAFMVALSVLVTVVRHMEQGQTRAELRAEMKRVWEEARKEVEPAVKEMQEAIKNGGTSRPSRRDKVHHNVVADIVNHSGTEDSSVGKEVQQPGQEPGQAAARDGYSAGEHEALGNNAPVAAAHDTMDHGGVYARGAGGADGRPGAPADESGTPTADTAGGGLKETAAAALDEWRLLAAGLQDVAAEVTGTKTASTSAKEDAWKKQNRALNDDRGFVRYEVFCVPAELSSENDIPKEDKRRVWNVGGGVPMTAKEVNEQISTLAGKNFAGYDILVKPVTETQMYLMIDDLTAESVEKMKADGFQPSAIWETSKSNYQVIFRVPHTPPGYFGDGTKERELQAGRELVRSLTLEYGGDTASQGVNKSFRMAGFSNKKEGRDNAFLKIQEVNETPCNQMMKKVRELVPVIREREARQEAERRREVISHVRPIPSQAERGDGLTDDVSKTFVRLLRKHTRLAETKGWRVDQSSIDFRACLDMFMEGYGRSDVEDALRAFSPALADRHPATEKYVEKTVSKAFTSAEETMQAQAGQHSLFRSL